MDAKDLIDLSVKERGAKIIAEIPGYETIKDDLVKAKKLSDVVNTFIERYIELKEAKDHVLNNRAKLASKIDEQFKFFLEKATLDLKTKYKKIQATDPDNIYELSGAYKLAFASNATRTLSTTLGNFLESIATLSPYAINPEREFGFKIKGIDFIALNKKLDRIEYQQMKTQKNTLTGSQKERVVKELSLHENPIVCASFDLSSWTFHDDNIEKVAGADFWDRIGIPYDLVVEKVVILVKKMEEEYTSILEQE